MIVVKVGDELVWRLLDLTSFGNAVGLGCRFMVIRVGDKDSTKKRMSSFNLKVFLSLSFDSSWDGVGRTRGIVCVV